MIEVLNEFCPKAILTGSIFWRSPTYTGAYDVWVLKIKGEQNEAAKETTTEETPGFEVVMTILSLLTVYMFGGKSCA